MCVGDRQVGLGCRSAVPKAAGCIPPASLTSPQSLLGRTARNQPSKCPPPTTAPNTAVGELPREQYARLRAAGADRYLLRIESSNPELYASIHPPAQKWETRVRCLRDLKDLGFMVRAGCLHVPVV